MQDEHDHTPGPRPRRAAARALTASLAALRRRARGGAAGVRHRARHRVESARQRIDVVRHRVDTLGHGGRRAVVAAAVALVVLLAGAATSAALVGDGAGDRARRVAAPLDETGLLARDRDGADRSRRSAPPDEEAPEDRPAEEAPREEPDRGPERAAPSPEPSATDSDVPRAAEPSPSRRPEPERRPDRDDGGEAEEREPEPSEEPAEAPDWVHPMPGAATTSCYGVRWGTLHQGVDLAQPAGTPIRAVGAGTVIYSGWVFSGYGISVVIDHHNGFLTHYAHASETRVSVGQNVAPGQTIALEGSTGDSTGPHLHFEVHQGMWNQIEPTAWLRGRGVTVEGC